jgi:hypothetical protein
LIVIAWDSSQASSIFMVRMLWDFSRRVNTFFHLPEIHFGNPKCNTIHYRKSPPPLRMMGTTNVREATTLLEPPKNGVNCFILFSIGRV